MIAPHDRRDSFNFDQPQLMADKYDSCMTMLMNLVPRNPVPSQGPRFVGDAGDVGWTCGGC